jgi:hypothetical protein
MKRYFLSLQGTVTLSVLAFLAFLGRLFMDWRYEAHLMGAPGSIEEFFYVLMFLVFLGIYIWAIMAAKSGSRRGFIACLAMILLLNIGFAIAMYFVWCPPAYCTSSHNMWRWNWIHLFVGLSAAISLLSQVFGKKTVSKS